MLKDKIQENITIALKNKDTQTLSTLRFLMNSIKNKEIDLIRKVTSEVEQSLPAKDIMLQDIKMMNFKVKPVSGDIFSLAKKEIVFLQSLWKLGKIDEIVTDKIDLLDQDEQDVFFNYMEDLQQRTQNDIASSIQQLPKRDQKKMKVLEFEIFKDKFIDKAKLN